MTAITFDTEPHDPSNPGRPGSFTAPHAGRYLLVTFIVSEDGEPLRPMTETIAHVPLDDTGEPASFDDLNTRVATAIRRRTGREPSCTA